MEKIIEEVSNILDYTALRRAATFGDRARVEDGRCRIRSPLQNIRQYIMDDVKFKPHEITKGKHSEAMKPSKRKLLQTNLRISHEGKVSLV